MTRGQVTVREAERGDVPALSRLWETPDEDRVATSVERHAEQVDTRVVVADVDGQVAGCAYLRIAFVSPLDSEPAVHVSHLQVDSDRAVRRRRRRPARGRPRLGRGARRQHAARRVRRRGPRHQPLPRPPRARAGRRAARDDRARAAVPAAARGDHRARAAWPAAPAAPDRSSRCAARSDGSAPATSASDPGPGTPAGPVGDPALASPSCPRLPPSPPTGPGCCCSTATRWPTAPSSRCRWRTSPPPRVSRPTRSTASPRCSSTCCATRRRPTSRSPSTSRARPSGPRSTSSTRPTGPPRRPSSTARCR